MKNPYILFPLWAFIALVLIFVLRAQLGEHASDAFQWTAIVGFLVGLLKAHTSKHKMSTEQSSEYAHAIESTFALIPTSTAIGSKITYIFIAIASIRAIGAVCFGVYSFFSQI